MFRVIARRLLLLPLLLLGVSLATFLLTALSPYDPIRAYVGAETPLSPELKQQIAHAWGLDQPLWKQATLWTWNLARGDLGHSLSQGGQPVSHIISSRLGPSALLVALASAGYSKLIQLVMTAFQAQSHAVLWWGPLGVIGLSCANAAGQ